MKNQLGTLIRGSRGDSGLGVRELARRIGRSPSYIVSLECSEGPSGISQETAERLATILRINSDDVLLAAGKCPDDLVPETSVQVAIYREILKLSHEEQHALLRHLRGKPE